MFGFLVTPTVVATVFAHYVLQVTAPSNLLVAKVRRAARPTAWQAAGLTAIGALTLVAGHGLSIATTSGAPGWLNALVFVLLWDSIKFFVAALWTSGHVALRVKRAPTRSHDHRWGRGPGVQSARASAAGTC